MKEKITIEIDKANAGQVQALCIDIAISLKPWEKFVKLKILKGKKSFKLQAPRINLIDYVTAKKEKKHKPNYSQKW